MLINKTQQKTIIQKTRFANSPIEKFRGLMFEKRERFDYALVFDFGRETVWSASVHMLFVFFPIDLIYLSKEKHVVDIVRSIQPWTLNYSPKKPGRYLIEIAPENGKKIRVGDKIAWK